MITPREVPSYLLDPIQFYDKNLGEMMLARWGSSGVEWLFYWNDNYHCWTSYRMATNDDIMKVTLAQQTAGLV